MTNKTAPFNELMEGVLNLLQSKGYMESTLAVYQRTYTRIQEFLSQCGTDVYTPEIGESFLAGTNVKKSTFVAYACAIRRLNDFKDGKPFRSHHECPHIQSPPEFSCVLDEYLRECMDGGNKPATLQSKERTCGLFLDLLKRDGCTDISQMDAGIVSRLLLAFSNKDSYAVIRQFLRFLADKGITKTDLSGVVPRYRRRKPLPTTYTPEEIARMIGADSLCFLPVERLGALCGNQDYCSACFDGHYPTKIPTGTRKNRFEQKLSERVI